MWRVVRSIPQRSPRDSLLLPLQANSRSGRTQYAALYCSAIYLTLTDLLIAHPGADPHDQASLSPGQKTALIATRSTYLVYVSDMASTYLAE